MSVVSNLHERSEAISAFLQTRWLVTDYFYLNLWTIVHTVSGFLIGWATGWWPPLARRGRLARAAFLVALLVAWEFAEMVFRATRADFYVLARFKPENEADIAIDIIVGVLAGLVAIRFLRSAGEGIDQVAKTDHRFAR